MAIIRLLIVKVWFRGSLRIKGLSIIDRNVSIFILGSGSISLGSKVLLGNDVELQARNAKIALGSGTAINSYSRVVAFSGVTIGDRCAIAQFVSILDHDHAYGPQGQMDGYTSSSIIIGDDVWIGDKATILKGVTIGNRARIGAGTVVNRDIPAGSLAVGSPCRVLPAATSPDG